MVGLSHLFRRSRPGHFLAIDLGSDTTIRSFLFKEDGGRRIALKKWSFDLPSRKDSFDNIPFIGRYLHALLTACIRQAGSCPKEALIGLGGHLAQNEVETVNVIRERAGEPIREEELATALSAFRQQHSERIAGGRRYLLASVVPLGIQLDQRPLGTIAPARRGRVIRIVFFTTYVLDAYWELLLELRSHWKGLYLTTISDQAAIAGALIGAVHSHEALLVKVGAKTTEVSIVDHESVLFTGQFPYGGDAVTLAIARQTGLDQGKSEEIKRRFEQGGLPQKTAEKIREAVQSASQDWVGALRDLLRASGVVIPERIFLFGGGARLETIRAALTSKIWYHTLPSRGTIDVMMLGGEAVTGSPFWNKNPFISGPEEVALGALVYRLSNS